jgi:hypothetical protein
MCVHLRFKVGEAACKLGHWRLVTLGQCAHALRECLTDAIHFPVYVGIKRGKPFIIDGKGLDLSLRQFRVLVVGLGVERAVGLFQPLLEVGFLRVQFQPLAQNLDFLGGVFVAFDFLKARGNGGLVYLVEVG